MAAPKNQAVSDKGRKRTLNQLTVRQVETISTPGRHADGGGLYLVITKQGSRKWVLIYTRRKKRKEMGLGSAAKGGVSLAKAREAAAHARAILAMGGDPLLARREKVAIPTFGEFADELVETLAPDWRNEKHRYQWRMTLQKYGAPLRPMPLDKIGTDDVLRVLKPLWISRPETASRLRGRIERVLEAATVRGYRSGPNPAIWRGSLRALLPKPKKLTRGHHPAMPIDQLPAFVGTLRKCDTIVAWMLEFTILTAARSGEVFGARWREIDLDALVWTIPGERMKAGREHRVPLAPRALEILNKLTLFRKSDSSDGLVFPSRRPDRPFSNMTMQMMLRRSAAGRAYTVHGFRSTFRDWAGECTTFPRDVVEVALAHLVGDEVERAYRRSDALEKRRKLMEAWANFCEPMGTDNIIALAKIA
jgi:integrase